MASEVREVWGNRRGRDPGIPSRAHPDEAISISAFYGAGPSVCGRSAASRPARIQSEHDVALAGESAPPGGVAWNGAEIRIRGGGCMRLT
jgi:hypothetical protein